MKVKLDPELCEANALCMDAAPDVFRLDENDVLHVLVESPPESSRQRVLEAVRRCPRQALSIVD